MLKKHWPGLVVLLLVAAALASLFFLQGTLSIGGAAARDAYAAAKSDATAAAYREYYEKSYTAAEAQYHVSNAVLIQLGALREEAMLEVLRVTDEEYLVEDAAYRAKNIYSWLSVRGTGVFTVNMQAGEYLVDNAHHYVLVRVPAPEMTQFAIDHANTEQLFYADNTYKITVPIL